MSVIDIVSPGVTASREGTPGRASLRGRPFLLPAATMLVAAVAAWSSYRHMVALAASHGQPLDIAYLLPLSVDGMMIVAAGFLRTRRFAYIVFTAGILASVTANALAAPPDRLSRIISAWPALALLLVVELLRKPEQTPEAAEPLPNRPSTAEQWVAAADALKAEQPHLTLKQVAEAIGCSDRYLRSCRKQVTA